MQLRPAAAGILTLTSGELRITGWLGGKLCLTHRTLRAPPLEAISDDFAPPGRQEAWLHCCKVPSWLVCSPPQTNAVLSLKVEFQETVPQVGQLYVSKQATIEIQFM